MDNMPGRCFYKERIQPEDCIADLDSHRHILSGLDLLRNWLMNRYLVEANEEWKHLVQHGGLLDKIPFLHSYEYQRPGNKGPFYCNKGIQPLTEPMPEDAPHVANTMLEALAHHHRQQTEARDQQDYQWQQNNTE